MSASLSCSQRLAEAFRPHRVLRRVHRDDSGTITIASVFALFMFTMLLVMIVNSAAHLDDKMRRQNGADAAAYSGGVVLARGMNAIAFSNHLISDVFALTAFLREARDQNARPLTPEVLTAWEQNARKFQASSFPKFSQLGSALQRKVQMERELIESFTNLNGAASDIALPIMEEVLNQEMIPEFQRNVVLTIPSIAQQVTGEVAYRQGLLSRELQQLENGDRPQSDRGPQAGVLWRTNLEQLGQSNESDPLTRTLPAVDPTRSGADYSLLPDPEFYRELAIRQRRELAVHYLEQWNRDKLAAFDNFSRLSQFNNTWRIFACAQLEQLLTEYPETNLPMMIRHHNLSATETNLTEIPWSEEKNAHLEDNYRFVGVVYRDHLSDMGAGVFRNSLRSGGDPITFAEISLFVPEPRYRYIYGLAQDQTIGLGGAPGFAGGLTIPNPNAGSEGSDGVWGRENWPRHWDLLNQNWIAKLVPATNDAIPYILRSPPGDVLPNFTPPNLSGFRMEDITRVNTH